MIVAVTIMRMMEMPSHQVVGVIAMRNRLVTTSWAVDVFRFMLATVMVRSAGSRVLFADRNRMFGHSAAIFLMAQFSLVQIIDVSSVLNLDMPAIGTVLVTVFCS